jgi:hypothetical protein
MNTKFSKHLVHDCKTCAQASTCPFKTQKLETPKFQIAYSANTAMLEFKLIPKPQGAQPVVQRSFL